MSLGLATIASTAEGAAWRPAATLQGELSSSALNARGDVAAVLRTTTSAGVLHVRRAGGSFAAVPLPAPAVADSLVLSDSGEALLVTAAGDPNKPSLSAVHRAPGGELTVQPYPGFVDVQVAVREDGLGLLFARQADGQAVIAWKPPAEARFGQPEVLPGVKAESTEVPPFSRPQPALGFTEGRGVLAMREGETMGIRMAEPNGTFGPAQAVGVATDRSKPPRLQGRDGHMVLSWDDGAIFPNQNALNAATKQPGKGFGPAAAIGRGINASFPAASVDRNGRVVAAWSAGGSAPQAGKTTNTQQAREMRPGVGAFKPLTVPEELSGSAGPVQFDSAGTAVFAGSPRDVLDPSGRIPGPKPGFSTWSRAPDGTLAGPDPVSADAFGGTFLLNGRGQGVAFGRGAGLQTIVVFEYNEADSLVREKPAVSALTARSTRASARKSARGAPSAFLTLRLTKTARVRMRVTQLGRAGVVRVKCRKSSSRRGKVCKKRRVIAGWRKGQVGGNAIAASRTIRRFLRRPGVYRVSVRPQDSRGRSGRARSVRLRVRR